MNLAISLIARNCGICHGALSVRLSFTLVNCVN